VRKSELHLGIKHIETKVARTSQCNGLQRTGAKKKGWLIYELNPGLISLVVKMLPNALNAHAMNMKLRNYINITFEVAPLYCTITG
jgi:hypothetical protein